ITRRFWPLVGGAETQAALLAAEFQRRGCPTTILTARWQNSWPEQIEHHGTRVVRLAHPAMPYLGTWRYMTALSQWLARHRGEYDAIFVSRLKHDAYVALDRTVVGDVPVILRVETGGSSGECAWHAKALFGRRIARRCRTADAVVAPSPALRQELLEHQFSSEQVRYIPTGVRVSPLMRGRDDLRRARAALAAFDERLTLPEGAKLAIYAGRLHRIKNLLMLLQAWRGVIERSPTAKLWLVGEGPQQQELANTVRKWNLQKSVVLAGLFDNIDELLTAADVAVGPSRDDSLSLTLMEAMATAVPVVASDFGGNRVLIEHAVHGCLVRSDDPAGWADAIERAFAEPEQTARMAADARRRVESEFSLEACATSHLNLAAV
ncbi:MAG: glycosyltransferase family 4 protein, partial [Pirellulales bacterium]